MDQSSAEGRKRRVGLIGRLGWVALVAGVIALAVVLTASSAGVAAVFTDVPPENAFTQSIEILASRGCVSGFPDGTFRPDALMTRQQFAKSLALTLGLPVSEADACPFDDVAPGGPDTLYPDNYIGALAAAGIVTGNEHGDFAPSDPVTAGQAGTMLARSARLLQVELPPDSLANLPGSPDYAAPLTRAQASFLLADFLTRVLDPNASKPGPDAVSGVVLTVSGTAVPGATVTVRATGLQVVADARGRYVLKGLDPAAQVVLTAWAPGYFVGASDRVAAGSGGVNMIIRALPTADDSNYQWVSAFGTVPGSSNCQLCHAADKAAGGGSPGVGTAAGLLPFDEWSADAHAGSAHNVRFLSMYLGTDLKGDQSPLTRYVWDKDYGRRQLPPDPNQAYYGPGYKLDFPGTAGNCAACHTPVAALDDPYGVDPSKVTGVAAEGIGCDFCHKIWDVKVDPATGLPYENSPGVLSMVMRRPGLGSQFFAGPYKDVAPGNDTFSSVQKESRYCASCHAASFWGTKIYNSYGEWLASPYSDPATGRTCQDCHMPSTGATLVAQAAVGGNSRDPATVRSHLMPGASDVALLQAALTLEVTAQGSSGRVNVAATVTNDKTGHDVPTDSPLRQVLLVIQATGPDGRPLERLEGPVLPEWAGAGADPTQGRYAGLPGKAYAKILREPWTGVEPSGAYWNPTVVVSDTRLAAFASDNSTYAFVAPTGGAASVRVTLLYRRAFLELAEQKGWNVPDIVMAVRQITLTSP